MLAAAIFTGAYAVIAFGRAPFLRIDRAGAAIVGAVLMVVTGVLSFDEAVAAIDARTLVLLFSMMIIVAHIRLAGGIALFARMVSTRIARPSLLVASVVFSAGVLSALFVNDTVCVAFTPVVLDIAAVRGYPALPLLLALATGANIGSAATLTGNPQNMLIGTVSGIPFAQFTLALGPVALAGLAVDALLIWVMFRRRFEDTTAAARLPRLRIHRALLAKSLVVSGGVLGAFVAGYDTALVSAAGAAALLVTRRVRPRKIYAAIDWDLLMLFVGLFVLVGAGERAGFDRVMFEWLRPLGVTTVAGLSATAAVISNAVSNVPAVMLYTKIVPQLPDPSRAWLVLGMASTFAGNLTVLGSIANLIVVEGARRRGVLVTFWDYARLGIPLSFMTIALGAWHLARLAP
jgi:Na+/H+ antiporter NhaD/arsenite permease-like protein